MSDKAHRYIYVVVLQREFNIIWRSKLRSIIIVLRRCGGVTVLPISPLEPDSAWECDKCGLRLAAEDQQQMLCEALEVRKNMKKQHFWSI